MPLLCGVWVGNVALAVMARATADTAAAAAAAGDIVNGHNHNHNDPSSAISSAASQRDQPRPLVLGISQMEEDPEAEEIASVVGAAKVQAPGDVAFNEHMVIAGVVHQPNGLPMKGASVRLRRADPWCMPRDQVGACSARR